MSTPMNFQKDYRPVIASALWAWILLWIPTGILAWKISNTTIRVSDEAIHYGTGTITKTFTNIDLYRVRSVGAQESLVSGGRIIVTMSDGEKYTLSYIRNAGDLSTRFRTLIDAQRRAQNIRTRDHL
ncbi:hypothetical protein ACIGDM_10240 [Rothia koreensis]|uniref:hypothetical protein n=1 Tax=Rothia koreensis TaxID=592378 RepID=UPI0037C6A338